MYMCHIIIFFTYFCSEAVIFFLLHFLKISLSFSLSLVPKRSSHWGWYTVCIYQGRVVMFSFFHSCCHTERGHSYTVDLQRRGDEVTHFITKLEVNEDT